MQTVGCEPVSDRNHFYFKRPLLLLPYVDWTPWKARVQMKLEDITKARFWRAWLSSILAMLSLIYLVGQGHEAGNWKLWREVG